MTKKPKTPALRDDLTPEQMLQRTADLLRHVVPVPKAEAERAKRQKRRHS